LKIKNFIIAALAFGVVVYFATTNSSYAQTPLKVVTVNIDAVRSKSIAFKSANDQLLKIKSTIETTLKAEGKVLKEANAELSRKRTLLAPDAFAEERKKFEKRVSEFQRKGQASQKAMNKKFIEAMGKMNRKILEIIKKYAETNKVTLILPQSQIIFGANEYNINQYVLDVLNKEMPTVTVSMPAQ